MYIDVSHTKENNLKQVNVLNDNFCIAIKEKIDADGRKDFVIEFWIKDGDLIEEIELLEEDYYE